MAYLLTFSTYGSHLPGDARGSTDRHTGWRGREPRLEDYAWTAMCEPAFRLIRSEDRRAVRDAIAKLCAEKEWFLQALHVRTTHVHLIVETGASPALVLQSCKSYATRALKAGSEFPRKKYWTRS